MQQAHVPIVQHLAEIVAPYDLVICDIWGVLHNGMKAFEAAHLALSKARAAGKTVILLSNAPRPHPSVIPQLDALGVPRAAYHAVVTSGDMTHALLKERDGQFVYLLGPDRDLPLLEGLDAPRCDYNDADYILCTGLFDDETETPADYDPILKRALERRLTLLCANPDLVVERGDRLIYCAGSIAERYADMGGEAVMIGKPFAIAYEAACRAAEAIAGARPPKMKILAIGDAIRTDIRGANDFGIDSLFIANGIHAAELMTNASLDESRLTGFLAAQAYRPTYAGARLVW